MAKWILCFVKLYADLTFSRSFVTYDHELQGIGVFQQHINIGTVLGPLLEV